MKSFSLLTAAKIALGIASGLLSAAPAYAQNARSFVSGHGSDSAACTLAAPCRTFQHAHDQTNSGGEIDVLDAAGYGTLNINKAISIVNDGVGTAGVIVPSGIGITISAGVNDAVSLRGLSVEGGGVGVDGISFNTGASLTVENCVIRDFTNTGIDFLPNATSRLSVANSLVADNGNGIRVLPSGSGTVTAVFNRVQAINNFDGIFVDGVESTGRVNSTVYESVASGSGTGFTVASDPGKAPTTLMVFHSVATNNDTGLDSQGVTATLRVAHSVVTGNNHGWAINLSGVLLSDGDNTIEGNLANETAPTTYARK